MNGKVPARHNRSSDLEGLPGTPEAGEESIKDLADEGQGYEADVLEGVERAADRPEKPARAHNTGPGDEFFSPDEERDIA